MPAIKTTNAVAGAKAAASPTTAPAVGAPRASTRTGPAKAPGSASTARATTTGSRASRKPADELAHFDFQSDALGYALRRAQVHAYELFFEMLGALELSPARLTALSLIAMEPEINQATLARRLNVAGPSVMKLIDALEHAGFIRRMEVPGDRRRYSLMLTPSGNAMLETLRDRLAAYEAQLAQRLSSTERKQLMALLKKLVG